VRDFLAENRNYQKKDCIVRKFDDAVAFAAWFPARESPSVGLAIQLTTITELVAVTGSR
jgi:hypothetical protein